MAEPITEILADLDAVAHRAARLLVEIATAKNSKVAVSLSGGSTPKKLYELLAQAPYRGLLPWDRLHWFWGDERFVPADHPDSNFRMTRLALFDHVTVPAANIHPIDTSLPTPEAAATAYEATLQRYYEGASLDPSRPLFDLTLLGLGEDGHTASLFPGVAALDERQHWVAAVIGAKPEPRVTLTYPAIESSAVTAFLAAGASKRDPLTRIAAGEALPAARVRPAGPLYWLLDRAAASAT